MNCLIRALAVLGMFSDKNEHDFAAKVFLVDKIHISF